MCARRTGVGVRACFLAPRSGFEKDCDVICVITLPGHPGHPRSSAVRPGQREKLITDDS